MPDFGLLTPGESRRRGKEAGPSVSPLTQGAHSRSHMSKGADGLDEGEGGHRGGEQAGGGAEEEKKQQQAMVMEEQGEGSVADSDKEDKDKEDKEDKEMHITASFRSVLGLMVDG